MERNSLTTFRELQIGDRFYKLSDKKKKVWEVYMEGKAMGDQDVYGVAFKPETEIIFLRNKNEK